MLSAVRLGRAEARARALFGEIAAWFDRAMERVSGWYVRRTRYVLFGLGFAMAMAVNIDLPGHVGRLVEDAALRAHLTATAGRVAGTDRVGLPAFAEPHAPADPDADGDGTISPDEARAAVEAALAHGRTIAGQALPALRKSLGATGPILGRACRPDEARPACVARTWSWPAFLGWLVIGFGCTLGGQFWFDLLHALLRLRLPGPGRAPAAVQG